MKQEINSFIDLTLLKADASASDIKKLCQEALDYGFASVCVNPCYAGLCKKLLKSSKVKVCTVIGFPLGAATTETKACEAKNAVQNGADELDMVMNLGAFKSCDLKFVLNDIKEVRKAVKGKVLKVIIETCYLTKKEIIAASRLAKKAGADFVKTSTGFGPSGATIEDIKLIRKTIGPVTGIKASGGIKTLNDAIKLIDAGATRIGTSRNLVKKRT